MGKISENVQLSILNGKEYNYERPVEDDRKGYDYVIYGNTNTFPQYLYELYESCPIHQSIIEGVATYVFGNGFEASEQIINDAEETLGELVQKLINDYLIFGGFVVQKITTYGGKVQYHYVDFRYVRINKDNTKAYFSTDWSKYKRVINNEDVYDIIKPTQTNGLIYYKGKSRNIYPTPNYVAALKALEIEREIDKYHLNSIQNNFTGNLLINFINENADTLTEEDKKAVEKQLIDKYSGTSNSSKFLLSFVKDKDSVLTIDRIESDKSDEKFQTLEKVTKQNIFIAHRVTSPNLFGMTNEGSGFSLTEYEESFKIFYNTVIAGYQAELSKQFFKIFGQEIKFKKFVYQDDTATDTNI